MNTEIRHSTKCAQRAAQGVRDGSEPTRADGNAAPETKRREGLFVPFAAFASLAGAAGLPFVSF